MGAKGIVALWLALGLATGAGGQTLYRVTLTDKGPEAVGYLAEPARFLSPVALARYARQRIVLTAADVPVSATYARTLAAHGYPALGCSRWLNCVWVAADSLPQALLRLPFVQAVAPAARLRPVLASVGDGADLPPQTDAQLAQLNLLQLHSQGHRGQGIRMAVFDSGFLNVHVNAGFARLRSEGRLIDEYDVADGDSTVYTEDNHGALVLSAICGELAGSYTGAAPEVEVLLLRTEVVASETHAEEMNWAMGVEWADSAGAQLINSSLGYTEFDPGEGNYTLADLDGETTIVTQAAEAAAARGILVVNSAGNSGNDAWQKLGAPADGPNVLAVGAVTSTGARSSFSSLGPTADGRTKPDVVARGSSTTLISTGGAVTSANGTSFSSPLMAGFAASVWSAHPSATAAQLRDVLRASGHQASAPDTLLGWGIPDAVLASQLLAVTATETEEVHATELRVLGNPTSGPIRFVVLAEQFGYAQAQLTTPGGQVVWQGRAPISTETTVPQPLPAGLYLLAVTTPQGVRQVARVVVVP